MKIVIPMAGFGQRFQEAGYQKIKPLIGVGGKPMIQHVIEAFPEDGEFIFICNNDHLKTTELEYVLKKLKPKSQIIGIEPHRGGAVDTFLAAEHAIPDNEEIIFNYCDFTMEWDYQTFLMDTRSRKLDASLPSFRGFHPASLGDAFYCYVKTDSENNVLGLREKNTFGGDKLAGFASSGTFYFKRGSLAKEYAKKVVASGMKAENGERYFSLIFNVMISDSRPVGVFEIQKFICFGTPRDVAQYEFWHGTFKNPPQMDFKLSDSTTLIPASGRGKRFLDAGYTLPKPIIPVDGQPMIVKAVKDLPPTNNTIFVCLDEQLNNGLRPVLEKDFPRCNIISVKEATAGMVNTCLLAKNGWSPGKPLLISACDYGLQYNPEDFEKLISDPSIDVVIWTFKNHECVLRNPKAYAYVDVDRDGVATRIVEKNTISENPDNDHAVVSVFWYRTAEMFEEGGRKLIEARRTVGGEYYVATSINTLIASGRKVVPFQIDKFICWGTPDDLKEYNYWKSWFGRAA